MRYQFVPKIIRTWRKLANLTPEKVAVALNRTRMTILNWESGRTVPKATDLCDVAAFFGATPDQFFARTNSGGNHGSKTLKSGNPR